MRLFTALFLALVMAMPAVSETLTIAADPWPPFIEEAHEEGGVAIHIIREAVGRSGYDVELNIMPWARAEAGVKAGDYDILPGTWYTEARSKELMYSEPYMENQLKFIKRKGQDFEYGGLESLKGKTVAVIRDYGYGDAFYEADYFEREAASDLVTNVRKLVNGRVDLAIEDELVARFIINDKAPALIDNIEFVEPPYSAEGLHMTTGYENPKHEAIVKAFNEGLAAMKEDGTFDQILEENGLK